MRKSFFLWCWLCLIAVVLLAQPSSPGVTSASILAALGFTPLNPANNLSDVSAVGTARTNLGLGGSATQPAILSGTTGTISGTITGVGACASSGTATVTGATTSMAAIASPVTNQGAGLTISTWVSSSNTVSVQVCSLLATLTLTGSAYNVRVIQ